MPAQIVVSVRMSHAGLAEAGPAYLERARALTAKAEAFGATLAAWSATTFSFAWDSDSIDEAIALCVSLRSDVSSGSVEQSWACGVAEGEMELLAPTGQRAELAWGPALVAAVSLARIARPGEVLLDGDVRAVRVGELATVGTHVATDGGKRVRGWCLDVSRPWRRPSSARMQRIASPVHAPIDPDTTAQLFVPSFQRPHEDDELLATTQENLVPVFSADVLELVDGVDIEIIEELPSVPPPPLRAGEALLADRIRAMARAARGPNGPPSLPAGHRKQGADALFALRSARARLEHAAPGARCQASLALAVALALAERSDEALLEGLDALARAREQGDARAVEACLAFLARLYAAMSLAEEAARLRAEAMRFIA